MRFEGETYNHCGKPLQSETIQKVGGSVTIWTCAVCGVLIATVYSNGAR